MRPLELMLLCVGLAFLLIAGIRAARPWLRPLAILVVIVAALQIWLEGARWQAAPWYLVVLIAAWKAARPAPARGRLLVPMALLLLAGGFLTWALPVLETPELDGPHPVGLRHFHWQDPGREEARSDPQGKREIMISVWYPAVDVRTVPRTAYLPDFRSLESDYAAKLGWPAWMVAYLRYGRGRAGVGAEPAAGPFPLVLYSHGLNRNRFEAVSRMERLAANGYVVVAVDHPHGADFVLFPDGRIERFVNKRNANDTLADIDRKRLERIETWTADLAFVIDQVAARRGDSLLWRAVDIERIAAIGFSNGGSTALALAQADARVDVAVNLDGTPRGPVVATALDVPVLLMESEAEQVTDAQLAQWGISREQLLAPTEQLSRRMAGIVARNRAPALHVRIRGARHSNFTDAPLLSPLSAQLDIGGPIDSRRAAALIDNCVELFLAMALKDGTGKPGWEQCVGPPEVVTLTQTALSGDQEQQ